MSGKSLRAVHSVRTQGSADNKHYLLHCQDLSEERNEKCPRMRKNIAGCKSVSETSQREKKQSSNFGFLIVILQSSVAPLQHGRMMMIFYTSLCCPSLNSTLSINFSRIMSDCILQYFFIVFTLVEYFPVQLDRQISLQQSTLEV